MNKWTSALIGAAAGLTASAAFLYLFAPARGTTFDEKYQSRLDWALAEGDKAAKEREQELLQELESARTSPSSSSSTLAADSGAGQNGEVPPIPPAQDEG